MSRKNLVLAIAVLGIGVWNATAQNHWELVGTPFRCEGAAPVTASHITSAYDSIAQNSRTFVLTKDKIYLTTDQGQNWGLSAPVGAEVIKAAPSNGPEAWYGNVGVGTFRTQDGGQSWIPKLTGLSNNKVKSLAIDPLDANLVLCGCENLIGYPFIFKWDEPSQQWFSISGSIPSAGAPEITDLDIFDDGVGNPIFFAAISSSSGYEVWSSTNQGNSWSYVLNQPDFVGLYDLEACRENGIPLLYVSDRSEVAVWHETILHKYDCIAGSWEVISEYNDSPTWIELRHSPPNYLLNSLISNPLALSGFQYQTDPTTWNSVAFPHANPIMFGLELDAATPQLIYNSAPVCFYRMNWTSGVWVPSVQGMDNAPLGLVAVNGTNVVTGHRPSENDNYVSYFESTNSGSNWSYPKLLSGELLKDLEVFTDLVSEQNVY